MVFDDHSRKPYSTYVTNRVCLTAVGRGVQIAIGEGISSESIEVEKLGEQPCMWFGDYPCF